MTRGRSYLQLTGTQPFNDVVIGCASLKYFQQNSATLPKPKSKAECESQRAEIVSSLRKIACVVPLYALLPMTFCRRAKHARPSSWTRSTHLQEDFPNDAPVLEQQRRRHRTGPCTRDLELAAPHRRKPWGNWRQTYALPGARTCPPNLSAAPPLFIVFLHTRPIRGA